MLMRLTSVPRKVMEQIHLEVISKLMKDRKGLGTVWVYQHLSSLIPFYNEVIGAMDK